MHLSHQELRSLAVFFAKRFPTPADIAPLARTAHLNFARVGPEDAEADWFGVLALAQERGRLYKLVRLAAAERPGDENLEELLQIVVPPRRVVPLVATGAALGAATVVLCAVGVGLWGWDTEAEAAPAPVESAPVRVAVRTPAPELAPPPPIPVEPPPAPAPAQSAADEVVLPSPCEPSGSDEVVGYWYMGEVSAGVAGDQVVVPRTLHVRAEYPQFRNEYDVRTESRCILLEGTVLTLHQDAISVPPHHYWVPLTGADLAAG